jgi:hypothetical protein
MEERKSKKYGVCVFLFIMFLIVSTTLFPSRSFAGDMEILLDDLVSKGVLTKQDAEDILKKMQETKTKEMEKAKAEGKAPEPDWVKNMPDWVKNPPDWIKNIKFSGDFRLRYQWEDREADDKLERNRGRFRLRLGAETKLADEVKVGFGLASGSGDPRSTNVSFENTFEKKNIKIDYAFAEYSPVKWFSLIGGKFQNPLYRPSDLLWDTDITPEGAAVKFQYPVLPTLDISFNSGFFVLDEISDGHDPYMVALQPGLNWNITKDINFQLALAYYLFGGVQGTTLDFSSGTNTLVNGKLKFNYDAPVVSAGFGFKNPFGQTFIPYFGLFGEYVNNPDPDDDHQGFIAGLRAGHTSMKKFGDWFFEYSYRKLEKDAWPDVFPDSDFYGGATNVKGHEAIFNFGLWKNIWLGFDYYNSRKILGDPKQTENLVQVDFNFKF